MLLLQGFGMLLMEEAERISMEEHGSNKIAVISGERFILGLCTTSALHTHLLHVVL